VKDVEVVIIMMSTSPHFMTYIAQEFFNYMFNENLAEKCQYVVVRITNPEESRGRSSGRQSRRSRSREKVDPESIVRLYGLEREKIKAKVCKSVVSYLSAVHSELMLLLSLIHERILNPDINTQFKVYY
jgi:hypothetical protein